MSHTYPKAFWSERKQSKVKHLNLVKRFGKKLRCTVLIWRESWAAGQNQHIARRRSSCSFIWLALSISTYDTYLTLNSPKVSGEKMKEKKTRFKVKACFILNLSLIVFVQVTSSLHVCVCNIPPNSSEGHANFLFAPRKSSVKEHWMHTWGFRIGCQNKWQILSQIRLKVKILSSSCTIDSCYQFCCEYIKDLSILREPQGRIGGEAHGNL